MGAFRVEIKRSAAKEVETVEPLAQRRRIVTKIRALASDPRPAGAEKLAGRGERYRVRQGPWRILYEIDDGQAVVLVVKIGHRREAYR